MARTAASTVEVNRKALVQTTGVTLDGKPAKITGARLDFPLVQSATDSVEFAWLTVAEKVAAGRLNFAS